ncbi:MAG: hypothetical protein M3256_01865 [Actinomycetota bacterium]|nr:hypothetical protein [Actinomycetota bacterium]
MKAEVLDEPELEFGGSQRHVDPRFGIMDYGPADLGTSEAPGEIRVGLIGPADQLDGLRRWLERCRDPIDAKDERYPHLFPPFPGCEVHRGLHTVVVCSDRNTRPITERDLRLVQLASGADAVRIAVEAYAAAIGSLADENRTDVLLVARPQQLADVRYSLPGRGRQGSVAVPPAHPEDGSPREDRASMSRLPNFHDLLKARLLNLRQPIQIIRRSTWDEDTPPERGRRREDEATRAWNLHVALYYKSGGVPWRLQRNPSDLATCYVGVSFYRNVEKDSLDTAVAQVFNERGDGVIVRGGPARVASDDRQPHLAEGDAHSLLRNALDQYRTEHHTEPARVVLHKTSAFVPDELAGFQAVADERRLDLLELNWITNSESIQLFRPGEAPPLRGTLAIISARELALYTKGSVEFYGTYPGMHVPNPIGIRPVNVIRSPHEQALELLALTKMNWNQTRLDGRLPVTLRTANQVKSVLRFCAPEQAIATRYAHYM